MKKRNGFLHTGISFSIVMMFFGLMFGPQEFYGPFKGGAWIFYAGVLLLCVVMALNIAHFVSRRNAATKPT